MLILAFDTCLDKTYIVLRTEDDIIESKIIKSDEKNYHSAYLISTIRDLIKDNGYTPKDRDVVGINCKAIGVSSLEILSKADNDNSVVALDARKSKAYFYDKKLYGAVELEEVEKLIKDKKVITDDRLIERFKPLAREVVSYQQADYELGKILSDIIVEKIKTEDGNWAKVLPLYIQPPPVSV